MNLRGLAPVEQRRADLTIRAARGSRFGPFVTWRGAGNGGG